MENDISRENQIKCQSKKTCTITEVFSGVFFVFVFFCRRMYFYLLGGTGSYIFGYLFAKCQPVLGSYMTVSLDCMHFSLK